MPFAAFGLINYAFILVGKVIEVSISTLRIVLIAKGERKIGSLLAFIEIILWLLIVSNVLSKINEDPMSAGMYALGFTIGNYVGSKLEDLIGLGTAQIQIIVSKDRSKEITDLIFNDGFAYTKVEGRGQFHERSIIYSLLPRSSTKKLSEKIKSLKIDALISVHETKPFTKAFGLKKK